MFVWVPLLVAKTVKLPSPQKLEERWSLQSLTVFNVDFTNSRWTERVWRGSPSCITGLTLKSLCWVRALLSLQDVLGGTWHPLPAGWAECQHQPGGRTELPAALLQLSDEGEQNTSTKDQVCPCGCTLKARHFVGSECRNHPRSCDAIAWQ